MRGRRGIMAFVRSGGGVRARILAVAVVAALAGCDSPATPSLVPGTLPIEAVDVVVLESFPYQLRAQVRGYLPDGCTRLDQVKQGREGNVITVTITTLRERDAVCILRIEIVERTIPLEGTYLPGDYVLRVNGVERAFRL
jgi:inhibitor of cysteine peptidase